MGPVLIPVILFIFGVIAAIGLLAYLADKSTERHDSGVR
jgi:hypothetical protein